MLSWISCYMTHLVLSFLCNVSLPVFSNFTIKFFFSSMTYSVFLLWFWYLCSIDTSLFFFFQHFFKWLIYFIINNFNLLYTLAFLRKKVVLSTGAWLKKATLFFKRKSALEIYSAIKHCNIWVDNNLFSLFYMYETQFLPSWKVSLKAREEVLTLYLLPSIIWSFCRLRRQKIPIPRYLMVFLIDREKAAGSCFLCLHQLLAVLCSHGVLVACITLHTLSDDGRALLKAQQRKLSLRALYIQ